jgi:hypothetical protein
MKHNYWGYVGAGYGIAFTVLVAYTGWLQAKLRRTRRSAREVPDPR